MNKWQLFYEYARKSLDEDIERFQIIDAKAEKFLTLVSVVVVAFSGIVPWVFDNNFPPSDLVGWTLTVVLGFAFLCLMSSWSLLFRSIKLAHVPRMPLDDQVDSLFREKELPHIYYMLTKTCRTALAVNRKVVDEKGKLMQLAYRDIALSAWAVAISVVLIAISKLNQ